MATLHSLSPTELEAYIHTHCYRSMASYLPNGYYGSASGLRPNDYGSEPVSKIRKALKLAGYTYNRRMNFWD